MQKLWILETDASMAQANVVASEIFKIDTTFSLGGRLGLELASCEHAKLIEVRDALRAHGRQAVIPARR